MHWLFFLWNGAMKVICGQIDVILVQLREHQFRIKVIYMVFYLIVFFNWVSTFDINDVAYNIGDSLFSATFCAEINHNRKIWNVLTWTENIYKTMCK